MKTNGSALQRSGNHVSLSLDLVGLIYLTVKVDYLVKLCGNKSVLANLNLIFNVLSYVGWNLCIAQTK